jgi:glutaredoxin-related protein
MFKIFYLPTCGYSLKALDILHEYNLVKSTNKINCKQKDETSDPDYKLIPESYHTYPKIIYLGEKEKYFIGGCNELEKLIELATTDKIIKCEKIPAQKFIDRNHTCEILLKLIKLIN